MVSIITKSLTITLSVVGLLLIAESVSAQPIGILGGPAPNFLNQLENEMKFPKPESSFVSGGTTGVTDDGFPYEKNSGVTAVSNSSRSIDSLTIPQRGFEKLIEDNSDSDSSMKEVSSSESISTEQSKIIGKDSNAAFSAEITNTLVTTFASISEKPVTLAIVSESGGPPATSTVGSKNQSSLPTTLKSGSFATTPRSDNEGPHFSPEILEPIEKARTEKPADFDEDPDESAVVSLQEVKTESRNSASGVQTSWMIVLVGIFLIR